MTMISKLFPYIVNVLKILYHLICRVDFVGVLLHKCGFVRYMKIFLALLLSFMQLTFGWTEMNSQKFVRICFYCYYYFRYIGMVDKKIILIFDFLYYWGQKLDMYF